MYKCIDILKTLNEYIKFIFYLEIEKEICIFASRNQT